MGQEERKTPLGLLSLRKVLIILLKAFSYHLELLCSMNKQSIECLKEMLVFNSLTNNNSNESNESDLMEILFA